MANDATFRRSGRNLGNYAVTLVKLLRLMVRFRVGVGARLLLGASEGLGDWKKFKFQLNSKASDAGYDRVAGIGILKAQFTGLH